MQVQPEENWPMVKDETEEGAAADTRVCDVALAGGGEEDVVGVAP